MVTLYNKISFPFMGFIIALFICCLFMPFIIYFIKKQKWLDKPNYRKIHKVPIPTLGGIVIFLSMLVVILTHPGFITKDIIVVLFGSAILFITGIIDDIKDLRPRLKLYIQICAALLVVLYGIRIENIHYLGMYNINWQLSVIVSTICIVFFINAFNFIDGIDGLAGGLSIIALVSFSALFYFSGVYDFAFLSAILAGSCVGFLFFNFNPARIFMGDTGSLTIGFLLAAFSVRAMQLPQEIVFGTVKVEAFSVVFALVLIPSTDAFRVFLTRIIKNISPFAPDKTHIHHLMLKAGMTHKSVSLALYTTQILILLMVFFPPALIALAMLSAFVLLGIIFYKVSKLVSLQKFNFLLFGHKKQIKNNNFCFTEQTLNSLDSHLDVKHFNYFRHKSTLKKPIKKEIEKIANLN